jgi:multidrug transporter EmrE-like cation transporter
MILTVAAVGVADAFLKKAAIGSSGWTGILKSPWLAAAIALYLFQIFFFTYVFASGFKLSLVSILQTGIYALVTLVAGILYFGETLTTLHVVGIGLTLIGVVLLNIQH